MAKRRDKGEERDLAVERIERLETLAAEAAAEGHTERAARYGDLARRIGMRTQVALPTGLNRHVCRGCGTYLVPGRTSRVRLRKGRAVTTCLACDRGRRICLREGRAPREPRIRASPRRRT
ncbi:MAG TPA: ribonuclease P [Candidatus Thermoplasmatota archaeon]|nr:ribonuclease P [Candidatus Thermoplasmatota archaeon]